MKTLLIFVCFFMLIGCDSTGNETIAASNQPNALRNDVPDAANRSLSPEFKDYWYAGVAEISNYDLKITRYGEERDGNAVLIFVTEPFDALDQIKADKDKETNRSVLKLNATRDFYTGIYPYKIMSSTFLPLDKEENAIKVATSIQEWCGHTYMQLNNKGDKYDGVLYSYFQSEGNTEFTVENVMLENQIPNQLRIDPKLMPTGDIKIIPSTEYLRLTHNPTEALMATASLEMQDDQFIYSVIYNNGRKISYTLESTSPYKILSWYEEYPQRGSISTSTASLKKSLRTPYWNQNSNKYSVLRDSLGL
ncbi:hypothetical protein SAMN05192588_0839 [Nonlabens sp. Hel1_33_55]|uniref:septum formation inhibitor Maf n=1 Tax=Nonlabens sp. Hel1_33_55 TaxID=1336802 RepID=UPI000875ED43|nr:septum formation inhibitor Maf [Nonlabens sp. Hel1_33_55]SCY03753.1 hypothetical protein SAMN05192588_0839 [Nonlabens sp. Hel1_33_55]